MIFQTYSKELFRFSDGFFHCLWEYESDHCNCGLHAETLRNSPPLETVPKSFSNFKKEENKKTDDKKEDVKIENKNEKKEEAKPVIADKNTSTTITMTKTGAPNISDKKTKEAMLKKLGLKKIKK